MVLNISKFFENIITRPFFIGVTEMEVSKKVKPIGKSPKTQFYPSIQKNTKLAFDI